jgi:hypothetical protein
MRKDWQTAETDTVLALLTDSLKESIADHQEILDLLLAREIELPPSLSKLLEDASSAYMALSESVKRKRLLSRCGNVE